MLNCRCSLRVRRFCGRVLRPRAGRTANPVGGKFFQGCVSRRRDACILFCGAIRGGGDRGGRAPLAAPRGLEIGPCSGGRGLGFHSSYPAWDPPAPPPAPPPPTLVLCAHPPPPPNRPSRPGKGPHPGGPSGRRTRPLGNQTKERTKGN